MKNFWKKAMTPVSYILVAVAAVMLTLAFVQVNEDRTSVPEGVTKLSQLEQLLLEKFVDGADATQLEDGAADGMVAALGDRWSYYVSAEEYQSYVDNKNNSYVGIGVTIQYDDTGYFITKVTAGGPAQEAGIEVGDRMIAVDGQSIVGMPITDGKKLVQGPEGSTVEITLVRGEEELTLTVTRKTVKTVVASGRMLDGNIGLITIANFNTNCYKETMAAIESLRAQGAQALIFDVRFNGGGYQSELVKLLDALLPEGDLFHSYYYTGAEYTDTSDAACIEMPMAVLMNSESYSAAEFFAAALREYDWAVLVGEQTQGKGHFQESFQLCDGSAVAVSTGRYTTPKGEDLEGVGLTPDIAVEVTDEQYRQIYLGTLEPEDDPQVQAAINALISAKNP